jgi:hypothetical protein
LRSWVAASLFRCRSGERRFPVLGVRKGGAIAPTAATSISHHHPHAFSLSAAGSAGCAGVRRTVSSNIHDERRERNSISSNSR